MAITARPAETVSRGTQNEGKSRFDMSMESVGAVGGFDSSQMASKMAKRMMTDFDTNGDNSIDKKEFASALKRKGVSQEDADKIFNSIDTKGTGKITLSDIETSMKQMAGKMPPGGMPAGGQDSAPKSQGTGDTTTNSFKNYDVEDKNEDGKVSSQEDYEYQLKHPKETLTSDEGRKTRSASRDLKMTIGIGGNVNMVA